MKLPSSIARYRKRVNDIYEEHVTGSIKKYLIMFIDVHCILD